MAKKQATATETAAAARPARAAKSTTTAPRVRTAKHKAIAAEPAAPQTEAVPADTPQMHTDHHSAISRIAYGYWESRGYQGGSQIDDWLRAEQEHQQRSGQL